MKNSLFESITRAIDQHAVLRITDEAGARLIEPYLIFESAQGDMLLHGWQRGGAYRRTPPPHWCNLHLEDILAAELLPDHFKQPHRDYNPRSELFHRVLFEIGGHGPRLAQPHAIPRTTPPRRSPPKSKNGSSPGTRANRSFERH